MTIRKGKLTVTGARYLAKKKKAFYSRAIIKNPTTGNQTIEVDSQFGIFIPSTRKARNYNELNSIVSKGLEYKSVQPLVKYLDLNLTDIADLTGVSRRTISRWKDNTILGSLPSKNLVKLDTIIQKGINVFGGEVEFKNWLNQTNISLGDQKPLDLFSTPYGAELVEDAIEALEFGNVM